jgi:transposase
MIRCVEHSLKFANKGKIDQVATFVRGYTKMVKKFVNILWNENKLSDDTLVSGAVCNSIHTGINYDSRIRQCAAKQARAIVNSETTKRKKQLYMLAKLQREGQNTAYLQRKIDTRALSKPRVNNLNVELDPRFVDFQLPKKGEFDFFIRLSSIGDKRNIVLPIKANKQTRKWAKAGSLRPSIRLSENAITLFYEVPEPEKKKEGIVVGADQGQITCLSLSDGQTTKTNKHGYDLNKISEVLSRRKKGSKGFGRAQTHRKNYINWSINQLNFDGVREVRFEKIYQIRKDKRSSRKLSHWTYPLIKSKLVRLSEEKGFLFTEQDNKFRSQRCSQCGWVHKTNRKGKMFRCTNADCGFATDSDLNAASNHESELYPIYKGDKVCLEKTNHSTGFFWSKEGVFLNNEPIVRYTSKEVCRNSLP